MKISLKEARKRGVQAAAGDRLPSDNPYEDVELAKAWEDGYYRPFLDWEQAKSDLL